MNLSPEDRAYLDERYGRSRVAQWPIYVVSVLVAGLLAWGVWAYWGTINPKVTSAMTTYHLNTPNDHSSTATFEVNRRGKDLRATCSFKALARDHSTVGVVSREIPLKTSEKTTLTWTVKTTRPAFTIQWIGCTAPGQNSPK